MTISEFTNEQLRDECQRRVDAGTMSPDVFMTQQQSDDRSKLNHVRSLAVEAKRANPTNKPVCSLVLAFDMLDSISGNPLEERRVNAVNTTFYGREAQEEHRPEAYNEGN